MSNARCMKYSKAGVSRRWMGIYLQFPGWVIVDPQKLLSQKPQVFSSLFMTPHHPGVCKELPSLDFALRPFLEFFPQPAFLGFDVGILDLHAVWCEFVLAPWLWGSCAIAANSNWLPLFCASLCPPWLLFCGWHTDLGALAKKKKVDPRNLPTPESYMLAATNM